MKFYLSLFTKIILFSLTNSAFAEDFKVNDPNVIKAQKTIKIFQETLSKELLNAMKNGGPEVAIKICNEKAPIIAKKLSNENDLKLRRLSLKWRNPLNKPNAYEVSVLNDFEKRKKNGESISELTHLSESDSKIKYFKAIPMQAMCLSCHGVNIDQKLYKTIKEYYPDDKAINFKVGDIRGAFLVTIPR